MKLQTIEIVDSVDRRVLDVRFRIATDNEQSYMQSHSLSYLSCRRYYEKELDEISAFGREI